MSKTIVLIHGGLLGLLLLVLASALPARADAVAAPDPALPAGFADRFAEVNGTRIHYLIGGKGSPVVLLHGYAETGHMWHPILPSLARRHTVIVPDLRGAGSSAKPESGYDKKNMAGRTCGSCATCGTSISMARCRWLS